MTNQNLSHTFRRFSESECRGSSTLYELLAWRISKDEALLSLAALAEGRGQPIPNLLLGAVHDLLLKGKEHRLAGFYQSITSKPKDPQHAFSSFKDFCQTYRQEIIHILQTKRVQTNEVRRCGYLYPIFSYIFDRVKKPLALIEIGTSAGFQLLWDQYQYSYGTDKTYGNRYSEVLIEAECRTKSKPLLPSSSPPVTQRIGLDLNIVDLSSDEAYMWLNALIWPEHAERRTLFKQAAKAVQKHELDLREGNGIEMLPEIAREISNDSMICVFHTHVANQFSNDMKYQLETTIKQIGEQRDIAHIYNNMWDLDLHLDCILEGRSYERTVGKTDGHGRWFTWEL